ERHVKRFRTPVHVSHESIARPSSPEPGFSPPTSGVCFAAAAEMTLCIERGTKPRVLLADDTRTARLHSHGCSSQTAKSSAAHHRGRLARRSPDVAPGRRGRGPDAA